MNSQEKFDYALTLKPYEKKQDIPVFPHICTYAAVPAVAGECISPRPA